MEEKKMDLEAPLLSVRRFSAGPSASPTLLPEEEGEARPPPPRRASLPYYKSDLKSGPVRVPGVVPFVWEQTPGLPKNGARSAVDSGGKVMKVPKLPPGRIQNGKGGNSFRDALAPAVKVGSSVRTRKAVTFAPDAGTANSYESSEDVPKIVVDERVEKIEKENKVENADRIEMPVKTENMEEIEVEETVESEERIEKAEKVEKKLEKQPVSASENHNKEDNVEEDAFSDALDTLSRSESFFMNCSVSGISGIPDVAKFSGNFLKDPELRDFMIERFLPAAQAMSSDSPHYTFKKSAAPPRAATKLLERVETSDPAKRPPIPLQKNYAYPEQYAKELEEEDTYDEDNEDGEDEECYDDTGHFPSKGCGLLPQFCLKSSFCLLNPVPGMKVRGRHLPSARGKSGSPQIKNVYPISLVQVEELSWEAVYGKKLGLEHSPQKEVIGKLSESDTLTADCSSAFGNSVATGGTTPDKNDGHPSTVHERKDSVGILSRESNCSKIDGSDAGEKSSGSYREINHSNQIGSESMSSLLDKTLRVDSGNRPGSSDSKASSFYAVSDTRSMMSSGEIGIDSWSRESIVAGADKKNALQPEVTKVSMPISLFPSKRLNNGNMDVDDNRNRGNDSEPLHLKSGINPLLSLLPPPLPKSPSESWLSRTLPSVSSKNPTPQSLLGIQLQNRKQTVQTPSNDVKQETNIRPSRSRRRQIRFAEVLSKPDSQI
ncbi:uncharacterized protein LOC122014595 isoform X1 [Zingiber officinale]|uniref:Uncharacterized protein n=1 Tax=Zingiber officinale TaxID=94328 RepID=A0A8J5FB82_ZINOF|nr:uncharacterized protein LOC122014595 isoform X1 [Zingiber officinale]XP_042426831.1 uncharacterized protein LOC122014595 isoform X1 [Zingiber officinale]KAG6483565.1 hypothetical protein ZIOFF_060213 [Zingiber officinale]